MKNMNYKKKSKNINFCKAVLKSIFNNYKKTKKFLDSDSVFSIIANIVLAFLIVKFLLLPGLSLVFDTEFPVVAVVSESMQHDNPLTKSKTSFDTWFLYHKSYYLKYNITKDDFLDFPQKNGFRIGDILLIYGKDFNNVEIGDIIVFEGGLKYPIIHRVINITKDSNNENYLLQTKGDNNQYSVDSVAFSEISIPNEDYYGTAFFKIPYLGLIKIKLFQLLGIE